MRYVFLVAKGNIRKNKGVYIGIFILMFIVSVALCSILTYTENANRNVGDRVEEVGFGDMFAALKSEDKLIKYGITYDKLVSDIRSCDSVERVDTIDTISSTLKDCNGHESHNSFLLLSDKNDTLKYNKYNEKNKKIQYTLKEGEICVPICFSSMYNCKIGDTVILGNDVAEKSFKVAAFLEDPYMGSSVMGIKTVLLSEQDIEALKQYSKDLVTDEDDENSNKPFEYFKLVNIFKKSTANISDVEFEKELNSRSSYASYCWISLSKSQARTYMLMLTNIFSGILFAFVVMLIIAALVVLSHNINSTIELDYFNLGILKSVGMKNGALRLAISLGYLGATLAGVLLGIPVSIPVICLINKITIPSLGVYVDNSLNIFKIAMICIGVFALVCLFVILKTIKLSRVKPLKAIAGGINDVHFSSRLKLPISKRFLNTSLAYRQFVSEKRQYAAAMIVTVILSMFIVMMNSACSWINDEKTLVNMFSVTQASMEASYKNADIQEKAEKIIAKHSDYDRYQIGNKYFLFEDSQVYGYIIEDPDKLSSIQKGRSCKYDNEVLITQYIVNEYNKEIGDEVTIKLNGKTEKYVISGIYECSNDVGKNFAIGYDGYKKLLNASDITENWGCFEYELADETVIDDILEEMSESFDDEEDYEMVDLTSLDNVGGLNVIKIAINGITVFIYILGAVFVMITVSIVCGKILRKETKDFGIYKSIGFYSVSIRKQLAVRFAVTAFIGSIIGVVLAAAFSNAIFKSIYESFGIYSYVAHLTVLSVVIPIVFMTLIFALFAYIKARKIKKLETRILIVE